MESTLLRVAGALFCHDAKRASTRTEEIALNHNVREKAVSVRPDPKLGQPGPLAHKIFIALIKKHSNYGRPIQSDISFTKREIMRLVGRKQWSGRNGEQLTRALREIQYTFIRTNFKSTDGRFAEHTFTIFPEVLLERRETEHDPVERCTVTLARPIIASLNDEHFTCLNHALMAQLGTIGHDSVLDPTIADGSDNGYAGGQRAQHFRCHMRDLLEVMHGGWKDLQNGGERFRPSLRPAFADRVALPYRLRC